MLKQLLLIGTIVLYTGCSSKNESRLEKSFEQSVVTRGTQMQKTEKITITQNNEVKISLTVTYLNAEASTADEDEKEKVNEKFIVSLYQADDVKGLGLISEDQNLTLNIEYPKSNKEFTKAEKIKRNKGIDRLPTTVKKLSLTDPLLKNIPMVNTWNSYYYVEFPHTTKKEFSLVYQNNITNEGQKKYLLNFTKQAKYLYHNNKKLY